MFCLCRPGNAIKLNLNNSNKKSHFFQTILKSFAPRFICFVTLLTEFSLSCSIDEENVFSTRLSRICVLKRLRKYRNSCKNAKRLSEEKPVRARAAVFLIKVARTYLLARWLCFLIAFSGRDDLTDVYEISAYV